MYISASNTTDSSSITYPYQFGVQQLLLKLEYLGEDKDFPGGKIYDVEAIHVTTTGNLRKFTLQELQLAGRSLAFRSLNINHDESRQLKWPENTTLNMEFDQSKMAVVGRIRVMDQKVIEMIDTGHIKKVSIEQIPTKGESCSHTTRVCEQHGVAFIGLGLLEFDVPPGDQDAEIKLEKLTPYLKLEQLTALKQTKTIEELVVSDAQRECNECTDFEACHVCKHNIEEHENALESAIRRNKELGPTVHRDTIIAKALQACGLNGEHYAMPYYNRAIKIWNTIYPN